ncbi:MAG: ATP-dependent helicase HrpB [Chthoniobacterales bacterium]|nr:ATP-dependent helicase HrpB [Chthoniobacterales bacterium]
MNLPIEELRSDILQSLATSNRLIVEAPTGSGKSTQIPQMLLEGGLLGKGRAMILQPRRLAARMLAARVAQERHQELGKEVGYKIRLEEVCSHQTRLLFVTEGILMRQLLTDSYLEGVTALLFDEFHERHLYSDIGLMQALALQETHRPDLKIIVMSATLDTAALATYLEPCTILRSSGRTHPVTTHYLARENTGETPWELAIEGVEKLLHLTEGHLLVFMPGAYEIARTISALRAQISSSIPIFALHGELTPADQDAAVATAATRKIIVATNVAETSLTIDGVTGVIDAGLARVASFDVRRSMNTLLIEKISRASADQRAGRAGRTAPGHCMRLWTERDHERRLAREVPEIHRVDLSEVLLTLKGTGSQSLEEMKWLDQPDAQALAKAETLLYDLGATDKEGHLTALGKKMLVFPTHPRYARMLLAAQELGCVRAVALMAALTQSRSLLLKTDRKTEEERNDLFGGGNSDFLVLSRVFTWAERNQFKVDHCRRYAIHADAARQTGRFFKQFCDLAKAHHLNVEATPVSDDALARCILVGFADQVARRRDAGSNLCDLVHGRRGFLSKESEASSSRLLVAAEINEIGQGSGTVRTQLSMATAIDEQMLRELFPDNFFEERKLFFDNAINRVMWKKEKKYRDLLLESMSYEAAPSPEVSATLAEALAEGDLPLPTWKEEAEPWIQRLRWFAAHYPELNLPTVTEEERLMALEQWCEGAASYRDVKERSPLCALASLLTPVQQAAFEKKAPTTYQLPSGRKAPLIYKTTGDVVLSATIQELFGLTTAPRLAEGKVEMVIEILGPNKRPLQTTRDLPSFWKETYPKLKVELARRYPKHEWK